MKVKIRSRGDGMNRVKSLRLEKGITQQRLSMDIHVSQQYISKVENGDSALTEDIIIRLAKYFHVSLAYLLGSSDHRFSEIIKENEDPGVREWLEYYYRLNKENQNTVTVLSKYLIEVQNKKD